MGGRFGPDTAAIGGIPAQRQGSGGDSGRNHGAGGSVEQDEVVSLAE
jgi:hypothetical protein